MWSRFPAVRRTPQHLRSPLGSGPRREERPEGMWRSQRSFLGKKDYTPKISEKLVERKRSRSEISCFARGHSRQELSSFSMGKEESHGAAYKAQNSSIKEKAKSQKTIVRSTRTSSKDCVKILI